MSKMNQNNCNLHWLLLVIVIIGYMNVVSTKEEPKIVGCVPVIQNYFLERGNILNHDHSSNQRLANQLKSFQLALPFNRDIDEFNSGDREQDTRNELLVAGPHVNDRKCGHQLHQMLHLMDQMSNKSISYTDKHLRMASLLDSFGHYDSGHLAGRMHSFGAYDQCRNTRLDLGDQQLARTRFCWAKFSLDEHLSEELRQADQKRHFLRVGICLPESCHSRSLSLYRVELEKLIYSQFKLPDPIYHQQSPKLDSIFCTVDQNSEIGIPTNGKVLLSLLIVWLALLIYATSRRRRMIITSKDNQNKLWECLDVSSSWSGLVGNVEHKKQASDNNRRVELNALNVVKVFGCLMVVYGHVIMVLTSYSTAHIPFVNRLETEMFSTIVTVSPPMVDTFFLISGILMMYFVMKRTNKPNVSTEAPSNVSNEQKIEGSTKRTNDGHKQSNLMLQFVSNTLKIILSRYLRLVPLLAVVYWFKRSVLTYLGSGPIWDFGFNRETPYGSCQQESWLANSVLLMSAFQPIFSLCLIQTWSVSNEMFFVLTFTPIILIMTKRPRLALSLMLMLTIISNYLVVDTMGKLNVADRFTLEDIMFQAFSVLTSRLSHIYSYPIYRMSSYAIGVIAGYALYYYDEGEKIKDWPQWFKGPATTTSLLYIHVQVLALSNGPLVRQYLHPYHRLIFPFSMTIGKILWTVSNSIVLLRMMTDWKETYLIKLSGGKFIQTLNKLCYGVFLVHFDVIFSVFMSMAQPFIVNHWIILLVFLNVYVVSIVSAVIMFVAVENPIDKLMRRFVR